MVSIHEVIGSLFLLRCERPISIEQPPGPQHSWLHYLDHCASKTTDWDPKTIYSVIKKSLLLVHPDKTPNREHPWKMLALEALEYMKILLQDDQKIKVWQAFQAALQTDYRYRMSKTVDFKSSFTIAIPSEVFSKFVVQKTENLQVSADCKEHSTSENLEEVPQTRAKKPKEKNVSTRKKEKKLLAKNENLNQRSFLFFFVFFYTFLGFSFEAINRRVDRRPENASSVTCQASPSRQHYSKICVWSQESA